MTWTPAKEWNGQDAFLIGGGASLKGFNFKWLAGRNTIGCNEAFRLGPDIIKICLFSDVKWFNRTKWDLELFKGKVVTCAPGLAGIKCDWLHWLSRIEEVPLAGGSSVGWNHSTGAVALNLAVNLGAVQIFMLGFDLCTRGARSHWHNYYSHTTTDTSFSKFKMGFDRIGAALASTASKVKVWNVTDGSSRLDTFPKIDFKRMEEMVS